MTIWPLPTDFTTRAYRGETFLLPPHPAVRALGGAARHAVREHFPEPELAHQRPLSDFLNRLHRARTALRHPRFRAHSRGVLRALGEHPDAWYIDFVRLRGVPPGGPSSPAAEAAWAVHRDTWYANPAAQLNLWVPLVDVTPATSVQLYPAHFAAPVPNTSAWFDYDDFRRRAGFQAARPGLAHYPSTPRPPASQAQGITASADSLFLFAAQHLHGTPPHRHAHTRWSLDLRVVNRAHYHQGAGAALPDTHCSGCAVEDYPW